MKAGKKFFRKICPVCGHTLHYDDDVVICEICDHPHHAACWKKNKGCGILGCSGVNPIVTLPEGEPVSDGADDSDRLTEPLDEDDSATEEEAGNGLICPVCGSAVGEGAKTCSFCNSPLQKKIFKVKYLLFALIPIALIAAGIVFLDPILNAADQILSKNESNSSVVTTDEVEAKPAPPDDSIEGFFNKGRYLAVTEQFQLDTLDQDQKILFICSLLKAGKSEEARTASRSYWNEENKQVDFSVGLSYLMEEDNHDALKVLEKEGFSFSSYSDTCSRILSKIPNGTSFSWRDENWAISPASQELLEQLENSILEYEWSMDKDGIYGSKKNNS